MGLFVLPPKLPEECTIEELLDNALDNIKLYKENLDKKYLIQQFTIPILEEILTRLD